MTVTLSHIQRLKEQDMYKEKLFVIFLLLSTIKSPAQEKGIIRGKIIEQTTKQALAGATVTIKDHPFAVSTDSSGIFIISNIPVGTYTLIITNIGFQTKDHQRYQCNKKQDLLPGNRTIG